MTDYCVDLKTKLEDMLGKGLSDKAKLVALLEACGIAERDELERLLECKPSTLREARAALKIQRRKSSAAHTSAGNPAPEFQRNAGNPALAPEIQRQNSGALARAYKESPSEIIVSKISNPPSPQATEQPPVAEPKAARTRGSRLNSDWQLPTEWRIWARTIFPTSTDAQVTDQAEQFRDYWIAKPGAQACKLDWEATWRNWCRKGLSAAGTVRKPQHTGSFNFKVEKPAEPEWLKRQRLEAEVLAINGIAA